MVKGNTGSGIRNTSKSGVSFGVVLTSSAVKENIISETSSVDITDGAKLTKAKKLPYKTANAPPKGPEKVHLYPALGSTLHLINNRIIVTLVIFEGFTHVTRDFLRI